MESRGKTFVSLADPTTIGGKPFVRSVYASCRLNFFAALCNVYLAAIVLSVSPVNVQAQQVCPPIGADTDCGTVITVTDFGSAISFAIRHTGQPPYDTIDDTLVGVVNNSRRPISSMTLRSAKPIFDFYRDPPADPDGICGNSPVTGQPYDPRPSGCPFGNTGYEGPGVSFTNIAADFKSGRVNFNPPLAAGGGRAYFALEDALTAQPFSCDDVVNGAVVPIASGARIDAAFRPKQNLSLTQAAQYCGFVDFNWAQQHVRQYDPSYYQALNQNGPDGKGIFDPSIQGHVRLGSARTPYTDPPQGGGYVVPPGLVSYPFYYDYPTELANHQTDGGFTLTFFDAPTDPCLPGVIANLCPQLPNLPPRQPPGSYNSFKTRLVGILRNPSNNLVAVDLGIGFDWNSNYTGSAGGTWINPKTDNLPDNNGTGGITVTAVHNVTNYHYNDLVVTAVNDAPIEADAPPVITVSASPSQLWPPRPWMVPVTVSGTIIDLDESSVNLTSAAYVVTDEYGLVQPKGAVTLKPNGQYSFTIELQASRKGDDKDGRLYTITVSAEDTVGNKGSSFTNVIVPHDREASR